MPHKINDSVCICCGTCMTKCVQNAIIDEVETCIIDPNLCDDCGNCVETCPVEAIQK